MDIADKIRKIEVLIAGAKSDGERQAAEFAKQRLQEKITAQPIEYTVILYSSWKKKLFVAICNKHGLRTYRYARQKYTTTMVRISKPFMDLVLWPEHHKYAKILDKLTEEILTDLISKIHLVEEEVDETVIVGELPFIEDFPEARKPAYKPEIDFGELGKKRSSDQISQHYNKEDFVVAGKSSQLLISHTG